jgi:hypothetical protein
MSLDGKKNILIFRSPNGAVLEGTPFADQIDISRCGVQLTYVVVLGSIWIIF